MRRIDPIFGGKTSADAVGQTLETGEKGNFKGLEGLFNSLFTAIADA